jgi:hypothetical protein
MKCRKCGHTNKYVSHCPYCEGTSATTKVDRTICSRCGACAEHYNDRVDGKCHHCGDTRTVTYTYSRVATYKCTHTGTRGEG